MLNVIIDVLFSWLGVGLLLAGVIILCVALTIREEGKEIEEIEREAYRRYGYRKY